MPRILNYASPSSARKRPAVVLAAAARILAALSLLAGAAIFAVPAILRGPQPSHDDGDALTAIFCFVIFAPPAMLTGLLALLCGVIALRRGTQVRSVAIATGIAGAVVLLVAGLFVWAKTR